MDLSNVSKIIEGEPKYRADQIKRGLFVDLAQDWDSLTGLPKALREKLKKECPLDIDAEIFSDTDGAAVKALIRLSDGRRIETVLMRHNDGRNTVCVSCQVGCPMACAFCATGKMSLLRSLEAGEIVEQVLFFARLLKKEGKRVSGVVFMGMGEPFSNYDNVLGAIRTMNDHDGLNIGARHISISTCGVIDGIKRLAKEPFQVNLAISLHAPDDKTRRLIMPVARTHTIEELLSAVDEYIKATNRKVMFEYLMIGGINDTDEHARELAALMKGCLCMINIIAYNSTGMFKSATKERMLYFKDVLEKARVDVTIRYRHGRQVKGGCGQLVTDQDDVILPSDVTQG
ncbi:23S rRNA (adenine(2503)-C(2))-methyltransferase RlmN [Patescibacteria group bacterium]